MTLLNANVRKRAMWILVAAAALSCMPALAADTIDEIQVTATRRPAHAGEVSAALTIITSADIADGKLTTDALAAQPGVYLQQTTPGQGAAIIRGLKGSEILHLVDGFRLNNAIFRNAPTQYLALVAPGTVDRIEVVRGAPASLYGNDAVGGVVQILSRLPRFESDDMQIRRAAYVAYDTAEQGRIIRGSLDYGNRRVAALVSGTYTRIGDRRIGGNARLEPSGYESGGGRVALSLTPTDDRSWLVDFQFARQPETPRFDELVAGFGQTEPSSSEFVFAPNERLFAHVKHTRSNFWWDADWTFDAGWQRIVDDRTTRNFGASTRRVEQNQSDLFGLTGSLVKNTAQGSWMAGAEYYHDIVSSARQEQDIVTGVTVDALSRFPDGATHDQAAIFGNVLRRAGSRHTFSGGLRFSHIRVALPGTTATTRVSDLSADLGYLFELTDNWSMTANMGYGFRAPNVFDLGTLGERPGNRFNVPNPDLASERVTQLDFGLRKESERLDLAVSLYGLHYSERISSVQTGATTPDGRDVVQSRNIESADIYGVEASADWLWSDEFRFRAVLNFTRGEQREADASIVPGDRIPPFNGRLSLRYETSERWFLEPFLLFADEQNRLSPRDVSDVRIDPDGTAGWVTVNVRAQWLPLHGWRLGLLLGNLTDRRYRTHGSGIDSPGRTIGLSAQFDW